jgi:hypothetical protein
MIVKMVAQRTDGDCTIVALAMYLSETYEDVLGVAAASQDFQIHHTGMYNKQIKQVANLLGVKLVEQHKWDEETADGIICLTSLTRKPRSAHVVLLRNGLIFDGDLGVWDPSVYYQHNKWKPWAILTKA